MNSICLLCLVCVMPLADQTLVEKLHQDYEALLAKEPDPAPAREAASLLATTNRSDCWTNYISALRIIRRSRSKAAVPLLMEYMIRHVEQKAGDTGSYAETLTILTGEEIANPYRYVADRGTPVREGVEKLYRTWWTPKKETLTTNLDKFSDAQLGIVAERLVKLAGVRLYDYSTEREGQPTAYSLYHLVFYRLMRSGSSDPADWWPEELHPRMVPLLLRKAGHEAEPPKEPPRDASRVPYGVIPLLAALRRNGEAPQLPKVADDERQNSAARLACIIALYDAGEDLRTAALLSILSTERVLERRLLAILCLMHCRDRKAGAKLVELLEDANVEVRTAAVCALRGPLPTEALPKLKAMIDAAEPAGAMLFILDTTGKYKTCAACEVLVTFLEAGLEDTRKAPHLQRALSALENITDKRWDQAGPQSDRSYRAQAKAAVDWWKKDGKFNWKPTE